MLPIPMTLLQQCIDHLDPGRDAAYRKDGLLIIMPDATDAPNALVAAHRRLVELLTAYKIAAERGDAAFCGVCIEEMIGILDTAGMNFSEFAAFWPVFDTSYSEYLAMKTMEERRTFLTTLVPAYVAARHTTYLSHGYTPTTLQARADANSHKKSGSLARTKVQQIVERAGMHHGSMEEMMHDGAANWYIFPDGRDAALFRAMCQHRRIRFSWSRSHEGKQPDFVLRAGGAVLIGEHKHMKEEGGGQDKQMNEIIGFIAQREADPAVRYVAFLDGPFFGRVMSAGRVGKERKLVTQRKKIESILKRSTQGNYFVNTFGFEMLVQALITQK